MIKFIAIVQCSACGCVSEEPYDVENEEIQNNYWYKYTVKQQFEKTNVKEYYLCGNCHSTTY